MTTNRRDKGNFRKRHHDFSPEGDRDPGVFLPCFNLRYAFGEIPNARQKTMEK